MTTNTPPEVLALAREIGAKHDANKAYQYLEGSRDDYGDMRMIIAAIIETSERAAKYLGALRIGYERNGLNADRLGNGVEALRNMEHLK